MRDFQELADEAFRDLLAKHHRPVGLKNQLKRSAKELGSEASGESPPLGEAGSIIVIILLHLTGLLS